MSSLSLENSLYLKATRCEVTERPPVWMMRQAGRYMPEYRALRDKYGFWQMVRTPKLACEVTLQPIDAWGMDAAILFSDILVVADALGASVRFVEKQGPIIDKVIRNTEALNQLGDTNMNEPLRYVAEAIRLLVPELEKRKTPLIGFAGAPFTVACYMVEGKSSSDLKTVKQLIGRNPEVMHALLNVLTEATISYLKLQIDAGVNALQLFDTWATHLSWNDFETFSLPYIKRIAEGLQSYWKGPLTVFCKGSSVFYPLLERLPVQALSIDWNISLPLLRNKIRPNLALQGNLDPYVLYAEPEILTQKVNTLLNDMAPYKGYIFNLGHGIMPDMNPESIKRVVDLVKSV